MGIITESVHAVKIPQHSDSESWRSSSDRSSRWESVRRRIDERKFSTESQAKTVHKMARRSIKQSQRQRKHNQEIKVRSMTQKIRSTSFPRLVEESIPRTTKQRNPTYPPLAEESTPRITKRTVSFDDVKKIYDDVGLADLPDKEREHDITENTPRARKRHVSFDDKQEIRSDVDLADVTYKEHENGMNRHQETRF